MAPQWTCLDTVSKPLAVLGAGVLGRRLTASWLVIGYDVNLRDPSEAQRNAALVYIQSSLSDYETLTAGERKPGKLNVFADLRSAVKNAWFVLKAVPEKFSTTIDAIGELDKLVGLKCIVGPNSSSFRSSKMLDKAKPEGHSRVCNVHYQMPQKGSTVEIITDGQTDPDIIQFMYERVDDSGMLPGIAHKESTGLILNRLWAAIKREVIAILAEDVSDPKEIDTLFVCMFGNNPHGPCSLMDVIGVHPALEVNIS